MGDSTCHAYKFVNRAEICWHKFVRVYGEDEKKLVELNYEETYRLRCRESSVRNCKIHAGIELAILGHSSSRR